MTGIRRLDQVAVIIMGQAPPGESYNSANHGVPLIAGAGDFSDGRVATKKYTTAPSKVSTPGDIILSIRASIGDKVTGDETYCLGRGVAAIRPQPGVITRYLWHWLTSIEAELVGKGKGATFKQVNRSDIGELPIAVPSLEEQCQVAAILDHANELRAKRRQAIVLLDDLTHSIFLDMFGDPLSNMHRWPVAILGDLLSGITSGRSPTCLDRSAGDGEWGVLKLGAITKCVYLPGENKALPPNTPPDERYEVRPGDVLFSRKNTRELVAASAFVEETPAQLLLPDLIFRFEIGDNAILVPRYLHGLLIQPSQRRKIQDLAGGSAASMLNISKDRLSRIEIPLPPAYLQKEFSERIKKIARQIKLHHADLRKLDHLFESLQARAFRNEL